MPRYSWFNLKKPPQRKAVLWFPLPEFVRSFVRSSLIAFTALAATVALVAAPHAARAQTLTDITLFRLDSNNNTIQEGSNTRGSSFDGDTISNLYLLSGGSFVNSGDGAGVNLALALSTPGTYTYSFAMENVNTNTGLGINFFFNNNIATPSISARGPQGGGFVANGNATNTPSFGTVAGANTLTFSSSGRQITLTNFAFQTTGGPDQVSSFNNAPNGLGDTNGSFTLTVTATGAPEPGTLPLTLMGLATGLGMVGTVRRRKAKGTAKKRSKTPDCPNTGANKSPGDYSVAGAFSYTVYRQQ